MTDRLDEYAKAEKPFIDQLVALGWTYLEGNTAAHLHDVACTERDNFREVLLKGRLRAAIRRINTDEAGEPWLDEERITEAVSALERLRGPGLIEANKEATDLLLRGTTVAGDPERHAGRDQVVRYIDFDNPENNDFLVVNQFRVDPPGASGKADFIVPDLALFVNGIPLVVVECKNPGGTDPIESAITDLQKYANRREEVVEREGAERLFYYNTITIAATGYDARAGTITAGHGHYKAWKDTAPIPQEQVQAELGVDHLYPQQLLVAGMLRPRHLLDIVRIFTLFKEDGGETVKIIPRYQQFRAVHNAVQRLRTGQTREEHREADQRGGIIWHTQGSGKSLTMVFLVRAMRTLPDLRRFKVVVVTDRLDLERQLSATAELTDETPRKATSTRGLKSILREKGPDLVFAMIQKYQVQDEAEVIRFPTPQERRLRRVAEDPAEYVDDDRILRLPAADAEFEGLNLSPDILVLIDEAHRSHDNLLHANLMRALPNCAKIAFTGTPIIEGRKKRTHEIFGPFIDKYTITQSEADDMTVPIRYEGRTTHAQVADGGTLDQVFEDMFRDRSPEEIAAIQAKYGTSGDVLEAQSMIRAKARDMLRHYVRKVMPEGFKAQVVAVSRRAAVRYQEELTRARDELLAQLDALDPALLALTDEDLLACDPETQFLVNAHRRRDMIARLEFAAVISGDKEDPASWKQWTRKTNVKDHIRRFKKPLEHGDPEKRDGLAMLCVNNMLITGFDAPLEQVMYLDRNLQGYQLLQAIARVNRTADDKERGYVVDYYGVAQHLQEALDVYTEEDVEGALISLKDELPLLRDRHRRVLDLFRERGIDDISDVDACVHPLRDVRLRAEFVNRLRDFLTSLNVVMPSPEALPYRRSAKLLGFINRSAANLYRDELSIAGVGAKVRQLIDDYIEAEDPTLKIPPVDITAAEFDEVVERRRSPRAKASEMEHALRYHIQHHYDEDPVYYRKLSERLEAILKQFEDNWQAQLEAMQPLKREVVEHDRQPDATTGLSPLQARFQRVLVDKAEGTDELIDITQELVENIIRPDVRQVDFWRQPHKQEALKSKVLQFLDRHDLFEFSQLQAVADEIVDVARANQERF